MWCLFLSTFANQLPARKKKSHPPPQKKIAILCKTIAKINDFVWFTVASISKLLLPATGSYSPESNILVIASVNLNSIFLGWPEGCSNALSTVVCFPEEVDRAFLEGGCAGWSSTLCRFLELAPGFADDIRCMFSALSFALKKSTRGTQCNPLEAMNVHMTRNWWRS